jgi:hypothetical protein
MVVLLSETRRCNVLPYMIEQWASTRRDFSLGSGAVWIEAVRLTTKRTLPERGVIWLPADHYAAAARRSGEQRWDR